MPSSVPDLYPKLNPERTLSLSKGAEIEVLYSWRDM